MIANPKNLGAPGAFNRGLAEARGEFLVRLDADDLLTPGSLGRAIAVMQSFPNVGLVYGHPLHFVGDQLPPPRLAARWWTTWLGHEWLALRCADGTNVITSPEVVIRRSILEKVGGMRPLAHTHDMELWLRVSAHSDVAYVGGVDQAWHREHPSSLSNQAENPTVILSELRAAFEELFSSLSDTYPEKAELRAISRRAVSRQAIAQARRIVDRGHHAPLVEQLCSFALDTDPTIALTAAWRRLERRRARSLPRAWAMLSGATARLGRRLTVAVRGRRWSRTGVYERIHRRNGSAVR